MSTEAAMGIRWDCTTDGSFPATVSKILNPITKTVISIEPPIEVGSDAELDAIYNRFFSYCKIAWDLPQADGPGAFRLDPKVIGADWLKRTPPVPAEAQSPQPA